MADTAPAPAFAPGQLWSLKPPVDPGVRVRIGVVERQGGQTGVHVEILHVPLPEGFAVDEADQGERLSIGHVPMTEEALARSVDVLEAEGTALSGPFDQSFALWRIEQAAGRGGYFAEPAAAVLEVLFAAIKQSQRPTLRGE